MAFTAFRSLRFWVVAGLLAVLAAGWSFAFYNFSLSQESAAAVTELTEARGTLDKRLGSVTRERDELAANKSAVEGAAKRREDDAKKRGDAVKLREDEVKKREDAVKQREDAVTEQERIQAQNTISEGNWAVGVDIQPGTYRTKEAVSGSCYWEINSDANGDNIVANDIVSGGRPTVTLKNGQFFSSNRCGEWIKV